MILGSLHKFTEVFEGRIGRTFLCKVLDLEL